MIRCGGHAASHTSAHRMYEEECPKAPAEDIVYLKKLGGCGDQMKGCKVQRSLVSQLWGSGSTLGLRIHGDVSTPVREGPGSMGSTCLPTSCCLSLLWDISNPRASHHVVP